MKYEHDYMILFCAKNTKIAGGIAARGSHQLEAVADIVVARDGKILKDRFGNAKEVLAELEAVS